MQKGTNVGFGSKILRANGKEVTSELRTCEVDCRRRGARDRNGYTGGTGREARTIQIDRRLSVDGRDL